MPIQHLEDFHGKGGWMESVDRPMKSGGGAAGSGSIKPAILGYSEFPRRVFRLSDPPEVKQCLVALTFGCDGVKGPLIVEASSKCHTIQAAIWSYREFARRWVAISVR